MNDREMDNVNRDDGTARGVSIHVRDAVKRYEGGRITALDGVGLDVAAGQFVAICGPSGCGKSTLLNMLSAIDRPDSGEVIVGDQPLSSLSPAEENTFRATIVGLVFQSHNLLPNLTAAENVQIPMLCVEADPHKRIARARSLLESVGLGDRLASLPSTLSGGERQRVAVARALANSPSLLLADEPTGALDSNSGERLFDLLDQLQSDLGTTLVVVTHNTGVAARAGRVVHMLDGRINS